MPMYYQNRVLRVTTSRAPQLHRSPPVCNELDIATPPASLPLFHPSHSCRFSCAIQQVRVLTLAEVNSTQFFSF